MVILSTFANQEQEEAATWLRNIMFKQSIPPTMSLDISKKNYLSNENLVSVELPYNDIVVITTNVIGAEMGRVLVGTRSS